MEARQNHFSVAREIFATGLSQDSHCAPLYHAAALLEAKLGNLGVFFFCLSVCHHSMHLNVLIMSHQGSFGAP
jgi:hypothetical protein